MTANPYFEKYYLKSLELQKQESLGSAVSEILTLVQSQRIPEQSSDLKAFFQGEEAFYKAEYSKALQYYLQARSVPNFRLFCYRASAYAAFELKDDARAHEFGLKAITVYPDDAPTQRLLAAISQKMQAAAQLQKRMEEKLMHDQQEIANAANHPIEHSITVSPKFPSEGLSTNTEIEQSIHNLLSRLYLQSKKQPKKFSTSFKDLAAISMGPHLFQVMEKTISSPPFSPTTPKIEEEAIEPEKEEVLIASSVQTSTIHQKRFDPSCLDAEYCFNKKNKDKFLQKCLVSNSKNRARQTNHLFFFDEQTNRYNNTFPILLGSSARCLNGFFIRWHGRGIVVNPGKQFLQQLFLHQLNVQDIDHVIVTHEDPEFDKEIEAMNQFNDLLNRKTDQTHQIQYFLCRRTYQTLSQKLKVNRNLQTNNVHSLELFLSSPKIEKEKLDRHIHLEWFSLSGKDYLNDSLGICLELKSSAGIQRVGFMPKPIVNKGLIPQFPKCNVLIAGSGGINHLDVDAQIDSADAFGCRELIELIRTMQPSLVLCNNQPQDGDLRLSICKLLRREISSNTHIFPIDSNLSLQLVPLKILCAATKQYIDFDKITVVKAGRKGSLSYLSPQAVL